MKAFLLILLLLLPSTTALNVSVSLLEDSFTACPHLFRIENLDHVTGQNQRIEVNLSYQVWNASQNVSGNSSHLINKFSTHTPGHNISNAITICAQWSWNASSDSQLADSHCWNYTAAEDRVLPEEIQDEQLFENITDCQPLAITGLPISIASGTQVSYRFEPWQEGDQVSYWVEDAFGEVLKQNVTTSSSSARRYTPKNSIGAKPLLITALRERAGCPASKDQQALIVTGQEQELSFHDELEILEHPDQAVFAETITVKLRIEKERRKKENLVITLQGKQELELSQVRLELREEGSYELSLPLSVPADPFCQLDEGEYALLIEGLDKEIDLPIMISHDECLEKPAEQQEQISSLYTRNKLFSEQISLRGRTHGQKVDTDLCLMIGRYELDEEFVINVSPPTNDSRYALLVRTNNTWSGKMINLSLQGPSQEPDENIKEYQQALAVKQQNLSGRSIIKPLPMTAQVVSVEHEASWQKKSLFFPLIAGVLLLLVTIAFLRSLRKPKNHKLSEYW